MTEAISPQASGRGCEPLCQAPRERCRQKFQRRTERSTGQKDDSAKVLLLGFACMVSGVGAGGGSIRTWWAALDICPNFPLCGEASEAVPE